MHRPRGISTGIGAVCVGVVITGLVAGCTSSSEASKPSDPPASTSSATATTPPSSVSPSSVAPSLPTSSAASPVPKPLSKFESDPGVVTMRDWAAELARAVTAGHTTSAKLDALMTTAFAKSIRVIDVGELGHYYPGPLPFTPISVRNITSDSREVRMCLLAGGYSQHPATHKIWTKRNVGAVTAVVSRADGEWRVSTFDTATFACRGVTIPTPSW